MKKIFIFFALTILSGCASIVKGSSQMMNVTTTTGKQVDVVVINEKGTFPMKLPQAIAVEKSSDDIIINVAEAECVLPSTTIVQSRLSSWFFGNIIFGGLLGSTTDLSSGSAWEYDNNIIVNVTTKDGCK